MVDTQIETPIHKGSSEFVARAADIITKLATQIDKCCPSCRELIKESILNNGAKVGNLHAGSTVSTNSYTQEKEVK